MLEEFTGDSQGQPAILVMMRDAYGNYVIQKALEVCQGADRERLIACIKEHLPALRKFTYGKHIIAHIEKLEAQSAGRGGGGRGGYGGGRGGRRDGGGNNPILDGAGVSGRWAGDADGNLG